MARFFSSLNAARAVKYAAAVMTAAALVFAGPASADPKPKGGKKVSAATIQQIYGGKTMVWSKGGLYLAADGTFQETWDGSAGLGNWTIDRKGNLCRVTFSVINGYIGPNPNRKGPKCIWILQTKDGAIWHNTDDSKSDAERADKWWMIVNSDGVVNDYLKPGNKIKSAYSKAYKKNAPNPRAVKAEASMQPITTEAQFVSMMVGKKLWLTKKDEYIYNADGTYSGSWRGKPFTATWKWKGQYLCRKVDGEGKEDCQAYKGDGTYFKGQSDKGKGGYWYYSAKR